MKKIYFWFRNVPGISDTNVLNVPRHGRTTLEDTVIIATVPNVLERILWTEIIV